jgi:hypothetical protein
MCHIDVYLSWRNNKLFFPIPILQVALMYNHVFSLHALLVIVKKNVNQYNEFACLSIGFTNTLNYLLMPFVTVFPYTHLGQIVTKKEDLQILSM